VSNSAGHRGVSGRLGQNPRPCLVALYTPAAAGGYIEELLEEGRPQTPEESKALADRHHWEIVGPNPL
jgi:hypothetical protein